MSDTYVGIGFHDVFHQESGCSVSTMFYKVLTCFVMLATCPALDSLPNFPIFFIIIIGSRTP
jgi:hypothetical protein